MMGEALDRLVMSRRVLVAVGAGGVGKTTTAAALGVAAALRGRRALCLTIDPARRLAEALGLERMSSEPQAVGAALFAKAGLPMAGSLTAMMLDTKRTFDDLVIKHSSTPERARKLLDNKLYQYVSTSLAGTQEYMAMEKLVSVREDPRYDLIVLDTPPTANALDFLDAPTRLVEALDSTTMRWFVQAFESTGKLSLNLLARSAALVLRGLGRITSRGFLVEMAEFISELDDLFGGFRQRAQAVESALRSPEVAFVLVTSPAPMSIREVVFFNDRLEQAGMQRGAFIVNRLRLAPPRPAAPASAAPPTLEDAERAAGLHGLRMEDDAGERMVQAYADAVKFADLDAHFVESLRAKINDQAPIVRVPELTRDVRDLRTLGELAGTLMAGGI
jgi:anion-transporting  ArsA/GET3 family ATPase